ncbi:MAG TPA: PAS domain-containing protein, partial [Noviherbaspirillum sp.]
MKHTRTSLEGLDLLSSAVLILDPDDGVTYANPAAENLLESSFKMLAQQRFPDLFVNGHELEPVLRQARDHEFADKRLDLTLERL